MNSFTDDDEFLSELTGLNGLDESNQIDFESLLQSFEDVNTNPLFNLSNQSNEPKNDIDQVKEEIDFQQTQDVHNITANKRKFNDSQSNDSNDDSCSIQSSSGSKRTNKQAALRYRLKKVNEKDRLFEAKDYLEKQNDDIRREINLTKTEIDQLKTLIVQMLMFKGIMSPTGKIINA
jgi:hypothetical protein